MTAYSEAVQAAAGALKRGEDANWDLARLTAENTKDDRWETSPDRVPMETWCADVREASGRRFGVETGKRYKRIWLSYGPRYQGSDTDRPSWQDAYWTDRGEVPGESFTGMHVGQVLRATPEVKAETAAKLLADPEVMQQAVAMGSPLSRALSEAADTQRTLREERVEQIIENDPISQRLRSSTSLTELSGILSRFAQDVESRLPHIQGLPGLASDPTAQAMFLRESVLRAETAIASVKALLTTGRVGGDVDEFVGQVLRGQE